MSLALSVTNAKVVVPVLDLDRAIRFYGSALGLGLRLRVGALLAELTAPGLVLVLAVRAGSALDAGRQAGDARVAFEVSDLDAAIAELREAGVIAARVVHGDGLARMALFRDPDGHALYLREAREGACARAPRALCSSHAADGWH